MFATNDEIKRIEEVQKAHIEKEKLFLLSNFEKKMNSNINVGYYVSKNRSIDTDAAILYVVEKNKYLEYKGVDIFAMFSFLLLTDILVEKVESCGAAETFFKELKSGFNQLIEISYNFLKKRGFVGKYLLRRNKLDFLKLSTYFDPMILDTYENKIIKEENGLYSITLLEGDKKIPLMRNIENKKAAKMYLNVLSKVDFKKSILLEIKKSMEGDRRD